MWCRAGTVASKLEKHVLSLMNAITAAKNRSGMLHDFANAFQIVAQIPVPNHVCTLQLIRPKRKFLGLFVGRRVAVNNADEIVACMQNL